MNPFKPGAAPVKARLPLQLLLLFVLLTVVGIAQSTNGTISGLVLDQSGRPIAGAAVLVVNDAMGVTFPGATNGEGIYDVPNLPPGSYRIQVSKIGFKTIIKPDVVLNLQSAIAINFTLPVGAVAETLTVEGGAPLVNAESAAVSTVVDRNYVENMPLNGRSLQDLILLTPGVVTNTPQASAVAGTSGEFNVNGQRSETNYYTVDGVSANIGISPTTPDRQGVSGSLPAPTALGTTQNLVPLDALEEFRVQSSTYSAEYGRNPGGQFSFVTRSGTNAWHGTAFEYLRNDLVDANDWFNDYFTTPKPALRQSDFGGTLGGPVTIPHVYDGKNRTFFFFSYEGLRLIQPQAAVQTLVPDMALRQSTPAPLNAVLNGFPTPTGADEGGGLAQFIGSWSNPGNINSSSIRLDHVVGDKLRLFFRFGDTSSRVDSRDLAIPSLVDSTTQKTRTFTFGATSSFSSSISNEFRLNYSDNRAVQSITPGDFDGATAANLFHLQGLSSVGSMVPLVSIILALPAQVSLYTQEVQVGEQKQWNVVDTVGVAQGRHQMKLGIDVRRLYPEIRTGTPAVDYLYFSEASIQANNADIGVATSQAPAFPLYTNVSTFAQDEWRLTPRLTLSMGLRWEINPAPGAASGNLPYTVTGPSFSALALAPQGTPLWKTSWYNFAPRFGAAYLLRSEPGWETVIRGGVGVFYDTAQQYGSSGYRGPGFSATNVFGSEVDSPGSFPQPADLVNPPIVNPPVPPYDTTYSYPKHLQLPYTLQWNVSVQQAIGKAQALTVTYVGANARRLLEENQVDVSLFNPNFTNVLYIQNGLTSDYNALQLQYQRRLTRGLQALASYTWSHSIDYGSQNATLPYLRGDSDFDVRHNFSAALSYDLPLKFHNPLAGALLHHWGVDDRFMARTGFPVPLQGNVLEDPATGQQFYSGLDRVSGEPLYIFGSECTALYDSGRDCPGGRAINPNAFSVPSGNNQGDAPRNFVRGFGAWQMDLAIRREFPIYERLKLQFRAEAFNVFNHPNFGMINSTYCSPVPASPAFAPGCTFGLVTQTLANSLGGLSSLYQMGGPRSMQFSLRLSF
jgi:hypothetical protein